MARIIHASEIDVGQLSAFNGFDVVREYANVQELIDSGKRAFSLGRMHPVTRIQDAQFQGRKFLSHQDCFNFHESYWAEGTQQLENMRDELLKLGPPESMDARRRTAYNEIDGDEICIDRLNNRDLNFWRKPVRRSACSPRRVSIFLNTSIPCYMNGSILFLRIATAVCVADIMEKNGFQVEINLPKFGTRMFGGYRDVTLQNVLIKDDKTPLNISSIAGCCAPSFTRGIFFQSSYDLITDPYTKPNEGLGHPESLATHYHVLGSLQSVRGNNSTCIIFGDVFNMREAVEEVSQVFEHFRNEQHADAR